MPGALGGVVVAEVTVCLDVEGVAIFKADEGLGVGLDGEFVKAEGDAGCWADFLLVRRLGG